MLMDMLIVGKMVDGSMVISVGRLVGFSVRVTGAGVAAAAVGCGVETGCVGLFDGCDVVTGWFVGRLVGCGVTGSSVGRLVGCGVTGCSVCRRVGAGVTGCSVGLLVGLSVGLLVGCGVTGCFVGLMVGSEEGKFVGASVGQN